jgi:hypothetical protein
MASVTVRARILAFGTHLSGFDESWNAITFAAVAIGKAAPEHGFADAASWTNSTK